MENSILRYSELVRVLLNWQYHQRHDCITDTPERHTATCFLETSNSKSSSRFNNFGFSSRFTFQRTLSLMRFLFYMLLACSAVVAGEQAAAAKELRLNSFVHRSFDAHIHAQRVLRDRRSVDEERGLPTVIEKTKTLFSTKVTDKTLQRWAANKKSPQHALIRLDLDNAGKDLFTKAKFADWVSFMTKRNPQNAEAAMLSALMTRYSDDVLSGMLIAAKKAPDTKTIATNLQIQQLRGDGQFAPWVTYVTALNKGDPKKTNMMVVKTLTTYNKKTHKGVYDMLSASKNKQLAADLQRGQFDNWLANNVQFYDVSAMVGAKGTPRGSPQRLFVKDYVAAYNKKHQL
ncbi:hypothetical protein GN244_ATG01982 [Phytophthora infestans]|uniref:RxLR effector protein n=1 Tax=Phytophthora infestans TaxID=4787 RepID=A0A833TCT0_PHYIN|nr:hypothetical protein GN244_ATG01982 [Phytophthora infestans]